MENFNLTFRDAQRLVDDWIRRYGGGYWSPLSMLAALVEEVGELSRELNAIEGPKKRKIDEAKSDIGMELADIVFAVICIANYYGIDLEKEFMKVIEKYTKRDIDRWKKP